MQELNWSVLFIYSVFYSLGQIFKRFCFNKTLFWPGRHFLDVWEFGGLKVLMSLKGCLWFRLGFRVKVRMKFVYRCVSSVSLAADLSAARYLFSVWRFPPAASSDLWLTPAALKQTHVLEFNSSTWGRITCYNIHFLHYISNNSSTKLKKYWIQLWLFVCFLSVS